MVCKMKARILITSASYKKAYPVLKSLYKAGYEVYIAFHNLRSPIFSRYCKRRFRVSNPFIDEKRYLLDILNIISNNKIDLIFPIGYIDNLILSKYKPIVERYAKVATPDYQSILYVSNKVNVLNLARNLGIKVPYTVKLTKYNLMPAYYEGPYVVKRAYDASHPVYIFGDEVIDLSYNRIIKDEKRGEDYIIQEFIPGYGAGYFTFSVDGYPLIEYTHIRLIEERPSGGASILACIKCDPCLINIGRRIVKYLKWTGVLMAEFKVHYEVRDYYLLEINPKLWGSLELSLAAGLNLPKQVVEYYLNKDSRNNAVYNLIKSPIKHYKHDICFSWLLAGIKYLKENPKIWLRMLLKTLRESKKVSSDIHLADPPELAYSLLSRLFNLMRGKIPYNKWWIKRDYLVRRLYSKLLKMNLRYIISDLDGTLVHLPVDWQKVKSKLIKLGLMNENEFFMHTFTRLFYNNRNLFIKLSSIIEEYELKAVSHLKYNPNLSNYFRNLRNKEIKIAIVSKQAKQPIIEILKKIGIRQHVDYIISREDSVLRKEQIIKALNSLNAKPNEAVMLGDTILDAYSSIKLGVIPIAITNNTYRYQQFTEYGIPSFKDCIDAFRIILKALDKHKSKK